MAQAVIGALVANGDFSGMREEMNVLDEEAFTFFMNTAIEEFAQNGLEPELAELADDGYVYADELLADLLGARGNIEELQERARDGSEWATYQLRLYVWEDHPAAGPEPKPPERRR